MKITLIMIFLNYYPPVVMSSSTTATTTSTAVCTLGGSTYAMTPAPTKISIPMADLKSCLNARHQIDNYSMLVSAACSAEE